MTGQAARFSTASRCSQDREYRDAQNHNCATSSPVRVIRCPIKSIRHAITVPIPASVIELPSALMLDPSMRLVLVAVTSFHPDSADPDLAVSAPIPVAGHPDKTATGFRKSLISRGRWRDLNINAGSTCLRNLQRTNGARRNQYSRQQFSREFDRRHHLDLQYATTNFQRRMIGACQPHTPVT